jgi:glycosyltransferase involved in cell wall biosynthesis
MGRIGCKGKLGVRIAYISLSSPFSRASWSGIPWYSHREILRRYPDTHVIETPVVDWFADRASNLDRVGMQIRRGRWLSRYYSRSVNEILEKLQPDVLLAVAAAHKIAYIDSKWPLVYAADAMYASVIDYYHKYAKLNSRSRLQGNRIQAAMLQRADRILLSSRWAIDTARQVYNLEEDRLSLVPLGANLDEDPGYRPPKLDRPLSLLFVGYDWERKGGDLALEIWRELRRRTGNAEFHIVGARPASADRIDGVYLHGRIDKSNRQDYARFIQLYEDSHFFVMPSRQEAYGIVLCEAAAFGRPAVAQATGGITTIVQDGETGLLPPVGTLPALIADRILQTWTDKNLYIRMCEASRERFRNVLNWHQWGESTASIIEAVVAERRR